MNIVHYVISPAFLTGALTTIILTVVSMALGIVGGLLLALIGSSRFRAARWFARFYVWLLRGTPVLLQLVFIFNVLPLIGLRFDSLTCAIIALSLNEAAYMSEIIRGGLLGVSPGQRIAAKMLGLSSFQTLTKVVLPQVLRLVLPPTGNQLVGMLKTSALASIVAVGDIMLVAQQTASGNFDYVNALAAAAVLYLILTTICTAALRFAENRTDTSVKSKRRRQRESKNLVGEAH